MRQRLTRLDFLRLSALGLASAVVRGGEQSFPPVTIHHLTDTHHPFDDGRLAVYVEALRGGEITRPALVVHGGDLVDGADTAEALRAQLASAKAILDRAGVPVLHVCHTHDRLGDPITQAGRSFTEVLGQPFVQHASLPGLELYLLSGSVTWPADYRPSGYDGNPPAWGFDTFDTQVLALFERFVADHPGDGGRRVLFTHHPIVPFDDLVSANHPDAAFIRPYHVIGEEGRARILPALRRAGIRHVFCGHCHFHSCNVVDDIEFITTPSFLRERAGRVYPVGFGVIRWDGSSLRYSLRPVA